MPVAVGSALAVRHEAFRAGPALAALLGALLIQTGTNLANDIHDFGKGADRPGRLGPPRVLAMGWITPAAVRTGMIMSFALATVAGVYLTAVAGWPVVLIGVTSIAAGVLYTAGPWALAYNGLGDLFVFLFFGLVAVCGTYFVQAGAVHLDSLLVAIPVGSLATTILVVNNVRDIETDRIAGKRTLAVRLGHAGARMEYVALVGVAFLVPIALLIAARSGAARPPLDGAGLAIAAPLLTLPLAVRVSSAVMTSADGPTLNRALYHTARLHVLFGLLFAAGISVR